MRIAITGGIGSGKSSVCKILNSAGEKTVNLDVVYKSLLEDESFCKGIAESVGVPLNRVKGRSVIDLTAVSQKVFDSDNALKALNDFTHPRIFEAAFKFGKKIENSKKSVFYEVPLLFEGGYADLFDEVWVVTRSLNKRVKSAALRDGVSEAEIEKRIKKQFDYDKSDLSAHTIIPNDGSFDELEKKVICALDKIKQTKK